MKVEVLVADEHPIIRFGLTTLLDASHDMTVGGEAADGHQTLELIRQREWGLVVLDLCMPGRNGLELIKLIKVERPRLPVLVFSAHREELYAVRAIRTGASGYLTKRADARPAADSDAPGRRRPTVREPEGDRIARDASRRRTPTACRTPGSPIANTASSAASSAAPR